MGSEASRPQKAARSAWIADLETLHTTASALTQSASENRDLQMSLVRSMWWGLLDWRYLANTNAMVCRCCASPCNNWVDNVRGSACSRHSLRKNDAPGPRWGHCKRSTDVRVARNVLEEFRAAGRKGVLGLGSGLNVVSTMHLSHRATIRRMIAPWSRASAYTRVDP
jgi:hypothetical protein